MQTTFTIEEIRKYILSQDSLGDVMYNLSAENVIEANTETEPESDCCCAPIEHGLCTQCLEHV